MTTKDAVREAVLTAKADKGMTWEGIASHVGCSPVFLTSACLGENSMTEEQAWKVCEVLDMESGFVSALTAYPDKGQRYETMLSDPLVYRINEVVMVYGETLKEVIQEKFGDGIMSAIDFTMDVEREEDPKGDRVKVTMNGKFLPYKRW